MSERSCNIPVVVRLRGMPDEGRLAEMSEMLARTVAGRLSEAADAITALEGWKSYRETHAAPVVHFSGGSLDPDLQRRVATAIEAGIARAVASVSASAARSTPPLQFAVPPSSAAPAAAPPRLDPRETETGWYLNGIPVFNIQRSGNEAESSRLSFQPLLSINADGSTRLQITVFHDADATVLLQPDAVSQLTRLASEIAIQDVVTVVPPEERPFALSAPASGPILQPTVIPERSRATPSLPTQRQFQQAVDIPLPSPLAASLGTPPSPPLPGSESGIIGDAALQDSLDQSMDGSATEWRDFNDQPDGADLASLGLRHEPDRVPQSLNTVNSGERHDFPPAVPKTPADDRLQQLTGTPEAGRVVNTLFDEVTAGEGLDEGQKRADRVIVFKSKTLLTEEEFAAGVERARGPNGIVLPYKKTGATGSGEVAIYASRLPGGRVRVHLRHDIFATDRDLRLPPAIGQGVELNEMDVVGVKFLDEGVVSFFPALLLMHLESEATRVALAKAGEAFAAGLTMGADTETAAAGGADAIATERRVDAAGGTGLAWADRIALGLDLANSRIQEHRGWIIENWPATGHAFVGAMEQLIDYARVHGLMQGGSRFVQFGNSLQKGYEEWRATVDAVKSRLSEADRETIEQIGKDTEELLQAINTAQQEVPPSSETAPASEHPAKTRSEEPGAAPATQARIKPFWKLLTVKSSRAAKGSNNF
jgi:hypothetical protein